MGLTELAATAPASPRASLALLASGASPVHWGELIRQEAWRVLLVEGLHAVLESLLVVALVVVAAKAWRHGVGRVLALAHEALPGEAQDRLASRSETLGRAAGSLGRSLIYFTGAMIVLSRLGLNVAPILASAGIVGVAIGFGAQSLVKDMIAGFFILLEDQFGVGDQVAINGLVGTVERMNLRATQLRQEDGRLVHLPNGKIEVVTNASKGWAQAKVEWVLSTRWPPEEVKAAWEAIQGPLKDRLAFHHLGPVALGGVERLGPTEVVLLCLCPCPPGQQELTGRRLRQALWEAVGAEAPWLQAPTASPEPSPSGPADGPQAMGPSPEAPGAGKEGA